MAQYEIPLSAQAQRFGITILDATYTMRVQFADAPGGGWFLDISNEAGEALLTGLPLVAGIDLLAQHRHLGMGIRLWVTGTENPAYEDLGINSHLIFEAL